MKRLLQAAMEVYQVLAKVYEESKLVEIDPTLAQKFDNLSWSKMLIDFKLPPPDRSNISQWINVINGWVGETVHCLVMLKIEALEQLLRSETRLADAYRQGQELPAAPTASQIPPEYPILIPGKERKRQTRLNWWDRFQTADGWTAQILRLIVAGSIVASVPIAVAQLGL